MDTFDLARQKYEKNRARNDKYREAVSEKKEAAEPKKDGPMVVTIKGPHEMEFEVHYAGTLLSSQTTKEALTKMFTRQLAPFGRVLCR